MQTWMQVTNGADLTAQLKEFCGGWIQPRPRPISIPQQLHTLSGADVVGQLSQFIATKASSRFLLLCSPGTVGQIAHLAAQLTCPVLTGGFMPSSNASNSAARCCRAARRSTTTSLVGSLAIMILCDLALQKHKWLISTEPTEDQKGSLCAKSPSPSQHIHPWSAKTPVEWTSTGRNRWGSA